MPGPLSSQACYFEGLQIPDVEPDLASAEVSPCRCGVWASRAA